MRISLLIISIFGLSSSLNVMAQTTESLAKVQDLILRVKRLYVEEVDTDELYIDFIKGMHNWMSPYSSYQKTKEIHDLGIDTQKKFEGIGVEFKFKYDSIEVISVLPGGAADNAGISAGDKIYKIDGKNLDNINYYVDVARTFQGPSKSKIEVEYMREGNSNKVEMTRHSIPEYSCMVIGDIENRFAINDFQTAIKYFDHFYADTVTEIQIVEHGIRYMLQQLDPHSTYISLEELHDMNAPLKGSFTGVGVRFQIIKDTVTVMQTIPGGPSEKVGIMAGDQFMLIDEENVAGIGIKNTGVRDRLLGEKGSVVNVAMRRRGEGEFIKFRIERDKIDLPSLQASYMATPTTGYLKLAQFSATSMEEIKKAISNLKQEGMEDLVLDLQSNGGGYLKTAVDLVDAFLEDNKLAVYTMGRPEIFPKNPYRGDRLHTFEKGRLIVLVDGSSASASEIVSGAIQDWDRGLIVGRRTFGKGLVQKPIRCLDNTQVRITTQRYYTPSGRCIQKPYDEGSLAYRREKYSRESELFSKDSIKVDDSLAFSTKLMSRTVYGGGGILPDVFVPLDTSGASKYRSQLIRKGIVSRFCLNYVTSNKEKLESKFPTFTVFNENFKIEKVVKDLIDYAEEEGLEFNEEEFQKSEHWINVQVKATIAEDLFDRQKYYQVINDINGSLQEALKILNEGEEFKQLSQN